MEAQNSVGENQSSDRSQLIVDAKLVGSAPDCVQAVADGRGKVELGIGGGGVDVVKKKRGRPPKAQPKPPPAKKIKEVEEEEDVCFICFDGGSLVLCDRRGCPKAYHPACIKRDEAFFQNAARWNCGWHICSMCQKAAHHMCYTCTYSLCRGCIRKADYVCVRGDKGFCTICMKTIMLIENNGQGEDGKVQADFDDKLSWEYLFKVYWVYLKAKLSLTVDELTQAKNPWKGAGTVSSVLSTTGVDNRVNVLRSITPATSLGNLEANESKRRKIDEQINVPAKETVNTEKLGNDDSTTMVGCKEWATKELLDFVAHMKDGDTSVLSQSDVQGLMLEYINRNNLHDPRKKNQIICDSTLKNLFGKPRVGDIEMSTLLEYHFFIKDDSQKSTVNSTAVQENADLNHDNMLMVGKDKSPRNRSKGEERALQNKSDEYAAVDVHNMNLIYLRQDLIKNLLEDRENFHDKVVGSIVRIRLSGSDEKHDMYRLVQVVGTSKVDEPCQNNSKLEDVMLEVLNLDKKETILSNTVSNEEFTEEECRRLQQSIRCRLVKHFTVGEIQEKAVALQPVRLNDWMEKEILRLNHLRDVSSEKGHKKGYRECVEKLQLLKAPDERERRLQEIPEVHSDPKMNPDYESDDTEEYFNKEHGDHMESKYSGVNSKNSRSPRKRAGRSNGAGKRSRKIEHPRNQSLATSQNVEEGSTALPTTLEKSQYEADCNGSTITKCDHQATLKSSVSNGVPEAIASSVSLRNPSSPNDMVWHYHDPSGKVQGPFSIVWLQRWSTDGCFPSDMRVWASQEDKSLLLTDVLKEHLHNDDVCRSENIMAGDKVGDQTEDLNVCTAIPSSTIAATPCAPNPVNHEKLSDSQGSLGQSFGQNWGANNNLSCNPQSVVSLTLSNESTGQLNTSDMPAATERSAADVNHVSSPSKDADAAVIDLPGPIPKKTVHEDEKIHPVVDLNPPSWSSASSLVVGGAKLPVSADGWGGSCSTPVKHEEWDSGLVSASSFRPLEAAGDHVATPTSNIDQSIHPSQPACNDLPTWNGVGEMIEFSTLAEESVSDLLAEVDAMESQYGLPSPTSRRNSFVDDLFNGSFDEFSPTPDPGTRSDGFSSSGDIQLGCHSTTTDEHLVGSSQGNNISGFDVMKTSQQQSFMMAMGIPERRDSENMGFKWPEMIDINRSAKAEGEEGEMETKRSDGGGMQAPKSIGEKLVSKVVESSSSRRGGDKKEESGLSLGLDPFEWHEPGTETAGGVEDWGYNKSSRCWWNKQSGNGNGNGAASKGKRVCRFYESGKCKKGASCKYLHP